MNNIKLVDFSSLTGLSINNYSMVYNSDLSSIFDSIEDEDLIKLLESGLIKNIILCFIKNVKLPYINIFEMSVDMLNETYKTTLDISKIVITEINKYMNLFYSLFTRLENNLSSNYYPVDEIDYKLVMLEKTDDNFFKEGRHSYLLW